MSGDDIFMKKKILSVFIALIMVLSMFPVTVMTVGAADTFDGGTGTAENPYLISKAEQMQAIAADTNLWSKHFKLTASINLAGSSTNLWKAIGSGISGGTAFTGSFDGGNHTISGLYVYTQDSYQGLFGYTNNATIKNLNVSGSVGGGGYVGGIVGYLYGGSVENCSFQGTVDGTVSHDASDQAVGGIVGQNHSGTVINCKNEGSVISTGQYVGGVAGANIGTIDNCSNSGRITLSGTTSSYVGGITGKNTNTVTNCYNSGTIDAADSGGNIGGISGDNSGVEISNCYNSGTVNGSINTGGIVGGNFSKAKIKQCYNTGAVSGTNYVGGITGQNDSNAAVLNSYNQATVEGKSYVGGIVGRNHDSKTKNATTGTVMNCYNIGSVTASATTNSYDGGVVGSNVIGTSTGTVTNCYYLSGKASGGINKADASGKAEVKTEAQFNSGEVAWMLQHAQTPGDIIWVQEILKTTKDKYPLLLSTGVGKDHPRVIKVTVRVYNNDNYMLAYTNNGGTVSLPTNPPTDSNHVFYNQWRCVNLNNAIYDSVVNVTDLTIDELILAAVYREKFGGEKEDDTVITTTYGVGATQNFDSWIGYVGGVTSPAGNFSYDFVSTDIDSKYYTFEGNTLTISKDLPVKDGGYTFKVNAKELKPVLSTLSIDYGIYDVIPLTAKIFVNKATPEVFVTASDIGYGATLSNSKLTGTATYLEKEVDGTFKWATDTSITPEADYAATIGYPVTFTPVDTNNYNSVTVTVTLTVSNYSAEVTEAPVPLTGTYNGSLQRLLTKEGTVDGGTMKYFLTDTPVLPDDAEFTSTVYSRANAGTYYIWYKAVGDNNHSDGNVGPNDYVVATIKPYEIAITPEAVTYNGTKTFTQVITGLNGDVLSTTLTASAADVNSYTYSQTEATGSYTVDLGNPNYKVKADEAQKLVINPRPVNLRWSEKLIFTYTGETYKVTADVLGAIEGDRFALSYADNEHSEAGAYNAKVTGLGNNNYIVAEGQGTQAWRIISADDRVTLSVVSAENLTYGDNVTLVAEITTNNGITGVTASDTVKFYVNGEYVDTANVEINNGKATATITVPMTSENYFFAGSVPIRAEYSGNANLKEGLDATTVSVAQKVITAELTGTPGKIYDGNNTAFGLDIELNGLVECDKNYVSAYVDNYTYDDANAGNNKTVTANGITLRGAQSSNYTLSGDAVTITGTIEQKEISLEWTGVDNLVYSGNPVTVTATANGVISGDEISVIVEGGNGVTAGNHIAKATGLASADGKHNNYKLPAIKEQSYTISPYKLYISNQVYDYTGSNEFSLVLDGVTPSNGVTEKVNINLTASSSNAGNYTYIDGTNYYTAEIVDTNYEIAGGGTLTIKKVDPTIIKLPKALTLTYTGTAQELIEAGEAQNGTFVYSSAENGFYSENLLKGLDAGDYEIWYMVVGDDNHNNTTPELITVTIAPYGLTFEPGSVTYNRNNEFTYTVNGVNNETVAVKLTANSKDVDTYVYGTSYFVEVQNSNYEIKSASTFEITPFAVNLQWSEDLIFTFNDQPHSVIATVSNPIPGDEDTFTLKYRNETVGAEIYTNTATDARAYIAEVIDLGNKNYAVAQGQSTQAWRIIQGDDAVTLTASDEREYGKEITLTAEITTTDNSGGISESDTVTFFINGIEYETKNVKIENGKGVASIPVAMTSEFNFFAGSVPIRVEYSGNANLKDGIAAVTLNVTPKVITATITGNAEKIYDRTDVAYNLGLTLNDVETCDKDDVDISADNFTYDSVNAGNRTITANGAVLTGSQSGNYTLITPTATGVITPKEVGLTWIGVDNLVYSGNPVDVTAIATGVIFGDEVFVKVDNGKNTDANTYEAKAIALTDSEGNKITNYALPDNATQSYTINPYKLNIPAQSYDYDGITKEFNIELKGVKDEKVKVKLTANSADAGEYLYLTGYSAKIDNTNYEIAGGEVLTINRVDQTGIVFPKAEDLTYNAGSQKLISEGSSENGTFLYSSSKDGVYTNKLPEGIDAGEYEVWYKVEGDKNHNNFGPESIKVTIKPYEIGIKPDEVIYNKTNTFTQVITTPYGELLSVTLTASNADAASYTYSTTKAAGKYTVDLGNTNYAVKAAEAQDFVIAPRPVSLQWSEQLTFTYTGETYKVTADVLNVIEGDKLNLTYADNEHSDAGVYTARVTSLGNENYILAEGQGTQPWRIIKGDDVVTITTSDANVYGDEITLIAEISAPNKNSGITADDIVEFFVNGKSIGTANVEISDGKATASIAVRMTSEFNFFAGSVPIRAEYRGNVNLNENTAAITVSVAQKVITADLTGNPGKTYDKTNAASGLVLTLTGVEDCDINDVTVSAESYTYDDENAGENKTVTANGLTLSGAQSGNYILASEPVTIEGTIFPKEVKLEWTGVNGLVYSGKPANVTATATELIPGDEVYVLVQNGANINAGTYEAVAVALTDAVGNVNTNYVLPADVTKTYTISPYKLYIPEQVHNYDGTKEFYIELDGVNGETVNVTLVASSANAGEYYYNADENGYTATLTNSNYEIAYGGRLIIAKAPVGNYKPPVAKELVYTGKSQVLIIAGQATGGTFMYGFAEDGVYSASLPEGTDVGKYIVWYYVLGDENHLSTEPQWLEVEIKKAPPIVEPKPLANPLTYNGIEQELVSRGTVDGGTLVYSLEKDGVYTEAIPTGIDAGVYTVWYKVIGDRNHNDAGLYYVYVTIEKANPYFEEPTGLTAVKGSKLKDVELPERFAWENPNTSVGNVGEHEFDATFIPEDTANFNTVTVTITVTVTEDPNFDFDNSYVETPDGFRCKMCDKYEANKDQPFVGFFYRIVHFFVHFAQRISSL